MKGKKTKGNVILFYFFVRMNRLNVFLPCGISDQIAVVTKAKTEDLRPKTTRTTGSGFGFSHLKNTPKLRPLFEFTANYSAIK